MTLRQIKPNMTEVNLNDNLIILFSYQTPVAVRRDEGLGFVFYRTNKKWSATTTRHINLWLGVYKKVTSTKPQLWFDSLAQQIKA